MQGRRPLSVCRVHSCVARSASFPTWLGPKEMEFVLFSLLFVSFRRNLSRVTDRRAGPAWRVVQVDRPRPLACAAFLRTNTWAALSLSTRFA